MTPATPANLHAGRALLASRRGVLSPQPGSAERRQSAGASRRSRQLQLVSEPPFSPQIAFQSPPSLLNSLRLSCASSSSRFAGVRRHTQAPIPTPAAAGSRGFEPRGADGARVSRRRSPDRGAVFSSSSSLSSSAPSALRAASCLSVVSAAPSVSCVPLSLGSSFLSPPSASLHGLSPHPLVANSDTFSHPRHFLSCRSFFSLFRKKATSASGAGAASASPSSSNAEPASPAADSPAHMTLAAPSSPVFAAPRDPRFSPSPGSLSFAEEAARRATEAADASAVEAVRATDAASLAVSQVSHLGAEPTREKLEAIRRNKFERFPFVFASLSSAVPEELHRRVRERMEKARRGKRDRDTSRRLRREIHPAAPEPETPRAEALIAEETPDRRESDGSERARSDIRGRVLRDRKGRRLRGGQRGKISSQHHLHYPLLLSSLSIVYEDFALLKDRILKQSRRVRALIALSVFGLCWVAYNWEDVRRRLGLEGAAVLHEGMRSQELQFTAREFSKQLIDDLLQDQRLQAGAQRWVQELLNASDQEAAALAVRVLNAEPVQSAVKRLLDDLIQYLCQNPRVQQQVAELLSYAITLPVARDTAGAWCGDLLQRPDVQQAAQTFVNDAILSEPSVRAQAAELAQWCSTRVINDTTTVDATRDHALQVLGDATVQNFVSDFLWKVLKGFMQPRWLGGGKAAAEEGASAPAEPAQEGASPASEPQAPGGEKGENGDETGENPNVEADKDELRKRLQQALAAAGDSAGGATVGIERESLERVLALLNSANEDVPPSARASRHSPACSSEPSQANLPVTSSPSSPGASLSAPVSSDISAQAAEVFVFPVALSAASAGAEDSAESVWVPALEPAPASSLPLTVYAEQDSCQAAAEGVSPLSASPPSLSSSSPLLAAPSRPGAAYPTGSLSPLGSFCELHELAEPGGLGDSEENESAQAQPSPGRALALTDARPPSPKDETAPREDPSEEAKLQEKFESDEEDGETQAPAAPDPDAAASFRGRFSLSAFANEILGRRRQRENGEGTGGAGDATRGRLRRGGRWHEPENPGSSERGNDETGNAETGNADANGASLTSPLLPQEEVEAARRLTASFSRLMPANPRASSPWREAEKGDAPANKPGRDED
ncbi:hypothetical protein BESB_033500 [Besnoitia besnoiti]|uniref:Uncharacterized protein n=1 Tax=Besnoitia besnoiti TaxID=94643 RepID=A0A2A9MMU3_BESBE|nr:hypothetical protein BESB_033500 [Besnoitia besnoiti]PFH36892.1 hypothetical protein BESB_033500 [Besnoitia besnoiti]